MEREGEKERMERERKGGDLESSQEIITKYDSKGKKDTAGDDRLELSWQTKRSHTFMIVSSLIATMTYQVGVNPPGGVWLDDAEEHKVGKAILAYNYPDFYPIFMCLNTAGFLMSLTTILLLIISLPDRVRGLRWAQAFISWCTILTTALSYTFSVIAISPTGEKYIYDRDTSKVIKFTVYCYGVGRWDVVHLRMALASIDNWEKVSNEVFQGRQR